MAQIEDQPPPVPNDDVAVWDLVIADMQERHRIGVERYGTPLQVENGRSHLIDAYQEQLDNLVYTRAEIERRNRMIPDHPLRMAEAIKQTHKYLHGDDWAVEMCSEPPCYWLVEARD